MTKIFLKNRSGLWMAGMLLLPFVSRAVLPAMPAVTVTAGINGEAAISALGANLTAVAAHYGQTADQLRASLRANQDMHLDSHAFLYYACGGPAVPPNAPALNTPGLLFPLTNTFFLHSKKGSTKTIYLDFDGFTLSGTAWNVDFNNGNDIVAPPFDIDGNPSVFGPAEQAIIQQVWFRVGEDYAPFDVDVTTEFPGEAAITRSDLSDNVYGTRALISPISAQLPAFANAGGVAYVGVFNEVGDFHKPALIFPENLQNNPRFIAEGVSHEVGHNLSLEHQGTDVGGVHTEYYGGHGNWAPIMGVGYNKPIVQFARGEYLNANNFEDALALIAAAGPGYRAADYGSSFATATRMPGNSSRTNGIISRTGESDYFYFQTGNGVATITVTNAEFSSNLHAKLAVYNVAQTLVTNVESVDDAAGTHGLNLSLPLIDGKYYVVLTGLGTGDPLNTGYSSYASLGQYTLSITNPIGTTTTFTAPLGPWGTNLSVMNGSNPNGAWLLFVQDDAAADTGIITNGWFLNLTTADLVGSAADNAVYASVTNTAIAYLGNYTNTIAVTNYGPSASSNVFVTDELPLAGLSLVSSNHTAGAISLIGTTLIWSVGSLQTNAGATLTLVLRGIASGTFTNTATVSALTTDPNPDDDTVVSFVTVAAPPSPPVLTNAMYGGSPAGFRLTVTGAPGYATVVQASTNLLNWANVFTGTPPFIYTNFGTTNYRVRFYRAVVGP